MKKEMLITRIFFNSLFIILALGLEIVLIQFILLQVYDLNLLGASALSVLTLFILSGIFLTFLEIRSDIKLFKELE